jgi:isocitrate/isopropylmalate dehydrogenase
MVEMTLETTIAAKANPARIVIAEGKVRTYDMGANASTLDVAKAVAEYAS